MILGRCWTSDSLICAYSSFLEIQKVDISEANKLETVKSPTSFNANLHK